MAGFNVLNKCTNLYPCILCNKNVVIDAIECSLCLRWVHRKCAKLTKRQLDLFSKNGNDWYCIYCISVFPFHGLEDDELLYTQLYDELSVKSYDLYKSCSKFNVKTFANADFKLNAREMDLDPDLNFYNIVISKCNYYTESQFSQIVDRQTGFSIIHFNARSLKSNFSKIKDYLEELDTHFDVIAISETWLSEEDCLDYNFENYEACHMLRRNNIAGGVALYIKSSVKFKLIKHKSFIVDDLLECVTVELNMEKDEKILVSCIYRTPGSSINLIVNLRIF